MVPRVTIKIIVSAVIAFSRGEQRPIVIVLIWWKLGWDQLVTWVSHVFDDRKVDVPFPPINQAARSWMTHQPVVYVVLDEDLSAELYCFI